MATKPQPPTLAQHNRAFLRSETLSYLSEGDRYLSQPPRPEYSFAVIGCGIMGAEHIRNTLLVGHAKIGGIYDPSPQSIAHVQAMIARQSDQAPATVYGSIAELCRDDSIDAIFICTPNFTHLEVLQQVAEADKAIFLEKPIATSVADAWQVCQLIASHRQPVRLGLQYRYKAIYAEAIHEVFERGSIGRVHSVNLLEHRFPFLDKVGQWNKFDQFSGGTLVEKCCHYFDLMNLFSGGRPVQVFASGQQAVNFTDFRYDGNGADALDHASVIVSYDNNTVASFQLCMFVPGTHEQLVLCGDKGRIRAEENSILGEANNNSLEIWQGERGVSRTTHPKYPAYIDKAGHHGSTFFEHLAFIDDLKQGESSGASIAEGFWSLVVGAAAQASIVSGKPIDIAGWLPNNIDPSSLG